MVATTTNRSEASVPAKTIRRLVFVWFGMFLVTWVISLDQTVFFAALFLSIIYQNRLDIGKNRIPVSIGFPILWITVVAIGALFWSGYAGNAARTAVVWGTALLAVIAYYNAAEIYRRMVALLLLTIWLASLSIYILAVSAPGLAEALLKAKIYSGFSSSRQFYTPSYFFDFEILRPVGFALYANELALFAILSTALYTAQSSANSRSFNRIILAAMIAGLILSTSRSLVLTYLVVIAVIALVRPRSSDGRKFEDFIFRLTLVAALFAFVYVVRPAIFENTQAWLSELTGARLGGSAELRQLSFVKGQDLFLENIWTGVGGLPVDGYIQLGSHSLPLSFAVRHGLTGLLPLALMYTAALICAIWAIYQGSPRLVRLGSVTIVALVASVTIQFDDDILSLVAFVLVVTEIARSHSGRGNVDENIDQPLCPAR